MNFWTVFVFLIELGSITLLLTYFRHRGFKAGQTFGHKTGFNKGYSEGRKDADNWWVGTEASVIHEEMAQKRGKMERGRGNAG